MVSDIIYKNANGDVIEFKNKFPILIKRIEGLSGNDANPVTFKAVNQHGETRKKSLLDVKQISIDVILKTDTFEDMVNLRLQILDVLNPVLDEGELIYKNNFITKKIKCVPEGSPEININGGRCYTEFNINLLAYEPFWEDEYETTETISTWVGGFSFPLSLPFRLRQKGDTRKNIINSGQVEAPVKIVFVGPADKPTVTNITTNEFIKVNRTITSDERLIINTEPGNKTIEIDRNGVIEDAFNYIDLDSKFFLLQKGDNLIEYSTDSLAPQNVVLVYNNRYIGI